MPLIRVRFLNQPIQELDISNPLLFQTWNQFKELFSRTFSIDAHHDLYCILLDSNGKVVSSTINDATKFWAIYNSKYSLDGNSLFEINIRQPLSNPTTTATTTTSTTTTTTTKTMQEYSPTFSSLSIHKCCQEGNLELLKELVRNGAHINARDENSCSPLHYAAWYGHLDVVKYLIAEKAFKNNKNSNGQTPLLCAVINGHFDIVKYLVEEKVFTFAVDNEGNSSLHLAAKNEHHSILKWMLQNSLVDMNIKNHQGKTYQDLLNLKNSDQSPAVPLTSASSLPPPSIPRTAATVATVVTAAPSITSAAAPPPPTPTPTTSSIPSPLIPSESGLSSNRVVVYLPCRIDGFEHSLDIAISISTLTWEDLCLLVLQNFNVIRNPNSRHSSLVDYAVLQEEDGDEGSGKINDIRKFMKVFTKLYKKDTGMIFVFHLDKVALDELNVENQGQVTALDNLVEFSNNKDHDFLGDELELEKDPDATPSPIAEHEPEHEQIMSSSTSSGPTCDNEFCTACIYGDFNRVCELISQGANVNIRDGAFKTPLHYAAEIGDIQICSHLISHKAFKNSKDGNGRTPLLCAALKGQMETVQYLIEVGCFTFVIDEDGNGLLHLAALSGHHQLVDWLCTNCDLDKDLVNGSGKTFQELLPPHDETDNDNNEAIIQNNSLPYVDLIPIENLPHHTSTDHPNPPSSNLLVTSSSPLPTTASLTTTTTTTTSEPKKSLSLITHQSTEALLNACFAGDFDVALRLLPMSDVNCSHSSSLTPLHFSCHLGNLQFTEALLRAGANPNLQDRKGMTPLHYCCQNRNVELIELLFRFDTKFVSDNRGFSPLHLAAISGDEDIFKLLTSYDGDINEIDNSGNSPFFYLLEGKSIELATWLVENYHPNIYLANIDDVTPLDVARNYGYVEFCTLAVTNHQKWELQLKTHSNTVKLFESLNAANWKNAEEILTRPIDPNLSIGGTYLAHICCKTNQEKILTSLLALGAAVNLQDCESLTPLMCAARAGHVSLVTILLSNDADFNQKDKLGWTAFFHAISTDQLSAAKILYGVSCDLENDIEGNTILHIACRYQSIECIRWLVFTLGLFLSDGITNNSGETILGIAHKHDNHEILKIAQQQLESMRQENTTLFTKALLTNDISSALSLSKSPAGINPNDIDPTSGNVVFHLACERGNVEIVKILLEQGASVTLEDPDGRNAIHCACRSGQLEIIRWLKKIGSSLDKFSQRGMTPFHYACQSGNLAVVRWLIDRGVAPTIPATDSSTSLHFASSSGNKELVIYLINDHDFDIHATNSSGLLPIDFAAKEGAVELVLWLSRKMTLSESTLSHLKAKAAVVRKQKLLREHELQLRDGASTGDLQSIQLALDFGININSVGANGMTALHLACSENKINVIQFLLEKDANINVETLDGLTPLHIAAKKGYTEIFNFLIQHHADVKALDKDGNDILIHASSSHTPELAKSIILNFPDFKECRRNRLGISAIHAAACIGNYELVIWFTRNSWITRLHRRFFEALRTGAVDLIESFIMTGIDINMIDTDGDTPLHILSHLGLYGLVQKSIQLGANENAVDATFRTPLHRAAERGYTEIVKYLCDMRVEIDAIDDLGMTPLLYACKAGHILTIAYLVGQGAKITATNIDDCNALHLACQKGDLSLVQWLCEGFNISEDQLNTHSRSPREVAFDEGYSQIFSFLDERKKHRDLESQRIQKEIQEAEIERKKIEAELELKRQEERAVQQRLEVERRRQLEEESNIETRTQELLKAAAIQHVFESVKNGKIDDLRELLAGNVDVNTYQTEERWTPLHFACRNSSIEIITTLIEAGADVNSTTSNNETPLLLAMRYHGSDPNFFWPLFSNGAKLHIQSSEGGLTPLHYLVEAGNTQLWHQIFLTKVFLPQYLLEDLLRHSAKLNQVNILTQLLELNIDIDAVDPSGKSALHFACDAGWVDCILTLLHAGATIENPDENGKTPLLYSILAHQYNAVVVLLENGASLFNVDHEGNTPLHYACKSGDYKIGTYLIQKGADIYSTNVASETPFQIATCVNKQLANFIRREIEKTSEILDLCASGDNEGVRVLISKKVDISRRDKDQVCGLHLAAQNGHLELCRTLLQYGLHVDTSDCLGKTPMSYACSNGQVKISQYLYDQGADIHHLSVDSRSYLHYAVLSDSVELVKLLITFGLDCNFLADENFTPLHDAAFYNRISVIKTLVENGALLSARTSSGLTPFTLACKNNCFEATKILLEGSDIDSVDNSGLTCFLQACVDNRFEMIEWLYSLGVNCWICGPNGDTALHLAVRLKNQNLVEWLVLKGFDPHSLNKLGATPIDVAVEDGASDLAHWMKSESLDPLIRCNSLIKELENSLQKNNIHLIQSLFQDLHMLYLHNIIGTHSLTMLLCGAASLGNIDEIDQFIHNGANITTKSPINGLTPLHYACKHGHISVVNYLIDKGADLNIRDNKNRTPLDISILHHQSEITELLHRLHAAASTDSLQPRLSPSFSSSEIHEINGANEIMSPKESFINDLQYPLHSACKSGDSLKVKHLLETTSDLVNSRLESNQQTPLHICVLENPDEEIINTLLTYGADPNLCDMFGMSSMHYSCEMKRNSMIILSLIKFKGSLTLLNGHGVSSLHLICNNSMIELMTDILDLPRSILKNLNLNIVDKRGCNLLHVAVKVGSLAMVGQLLRQGVSVNHSDQNQTTPLHIAVSQSQYEVTKLLLEHGADPNLGDNRGRTPIAISILEIKDVNFSRLLHQFGAKLDVVLNNEETFLHIACRNGNVELAKWLVRSGLNPSVENTQGKSPVELAHSGGKEDLLEWLLAWIVAVKVDRPVEMILAEATGSTPIISYGSSESESMKTSSDGGGDEESASVGAALTNEENFATLHGAPIQSISTRSKNIPLPPSSVRSNRQIALL